MSSAKIIYTRTDEAPALATYSLLPFIKKYTEAADVAVELSDISVAARILAAFPENLTEEQRVPDALAELGELTKEERELYVATGTDPEAMSLGRQ